MAGTGKSTTLRRFIRDALNRVGTVEEVRSAERGMGQMGLMGQIGFGCD
jgi:hypothetical protein